MRVVVTRPEGDALFWAQGLRGAGHEVVLLPLIVIRAAPDPVPIARCWERLSQFHSVMFVSANAVNGFFSNAPTAVQGWGNATARAWAAGPGTRQALLAQGVAPDAIDSPAAVSAQFDSESLWLQVRDQVRPGGKVLIVRGSGVSAGDDATTGAGRDWLSGQLTDAGVAVEYCVAYQRGKPEFSDTQAIEVKRWTSAPCARDLVWLFSSSEAIANLVAAFPGQSWEGSRALCTHPRIAERARACGFGVVWESRPALPDVVASIESTR